jgi:hypothetical protein
MTMKVQFDPLKIAGSELEKAVLTVDKDAKVSFHNTREESTKPVRLPVVVAKS